MGWMRHRQGEFDRNRVLAEAARARSKRRRRRAIELYRWALAVEPRNPELHARIAPLLAETRQPFDAWVSYQAAGQAFARQGLTDKAIAVYREATRCLPSEFRSWVAVARLQVRMGREREAVEALLEGSRRFHSRALRPKAIYLLRRAREIDPWDLETVLDLARLLASWRQEREAHLLLQGLAARVRGPALRRVRAVQFRTRPGLASAWRWLRGGSAGPRSAPQAAPARVTVLRPRRAGRLA